MTIGERLRTRRKELNLTLKDIHASAGIQTGNLSELERDIYQPSVQTLIALSEALDCSIDWILKGEEAFSKSLKLEKFKSEQGLMCDGSPLEETEADLIAMYRLLPPSHQEELFDLTYFKYQRWIDAKGASIYSTYIEDAYEKNNGSDEHNTTTGTA